MALVVVTRLHLRSRLFFVPFAIHTLRSARQAKRSPGFRGGTLGGDAQGGNWTITVWESEEAMRAFRNAGAHRTVMPRLLNWCDEASFTHYATDGVGLPAADDAYRRLSSSGKVSKVNHP
jgi:hypothetical protein